MLEYALFGKVKGCRIRSFLRCRQVGETVTLSVNRFGYELSLEAALGESLY
jgi:hypothetical protein